jgi:hypothetical protein
MSKRLPPCPIPEMGMLLSRGFFCRLAPCHEEAFPISDLRRHYEEIHKCRQPRLSYSFVTEGMSVTLVSEH